MDLYFFTAADHNPVYRKEAEILIKSGKKFGRDIHFYDIPDGEIWNRYKVQLISGQLPRADKYIYLDSDCVLTGPGDWESDECIGVCDPLYYMRDEEKSKNTNSFMRNHTVCIGEGQGYDALVTLWRELDLPIWCNSGVTVLPADARLPFCELWKEWMQTVDGWCQKDFMVGDEAALMFARHEFGLPLLPPRFNGMCKWQVIHPWHVLIHADGNVSGEKRLPYIEAVENLDK